MYEAAESDWTDPMERRDVRAVIDRVHMNAEKLTAQVVALEERLGWVLRPEGPQLAVTEKDGMDPRNGSELRNSLEALERSIRHTQGRVASLSDRLDI